MRKILALGLLTATSVSASAIAQTSGEGTSGGGEYTEIVVTALKRAESIQSVPAAITALGNESLQKAGIASAEDLATRTPGLEFSAQSNSLQLTIRGLGLDTSNGAADPTVAPYVNGVFIPRVTAPLVDLSDMDRVEVLRGPQGTLYGRNSTAGAVNFIARKPTNSFEGSATVGTGSYNRIHARGTIAGPITEGVGFRLSGSYDKNDGYIKNLAGNSVLTGDDRLGGQRRTYLHGGVSFTPSNDMFRNNLDVFYVRESSDGPVEILFQKTVPGFFTANYGQEPAISPSSSEVYSDFGAKTLSKLFLVTNNLEIPLGEDFTLKSITGYIRHDYKAAWDGDGTALDIVRIGTPALGQPFNKSNAWSQEINLTGSIGPVDLITGAYYFREKSRPSFPIEFTGGLSIFGFPPGTGFVSNFRDKSTTKAVFIDATVNVTDRLRVVGGVRYNEDTKNVIQNQGVLFPGVPFSATAACNNTPFSAKYKATTPRAGIQFDLAPKVMTYAQYQRGFKAGTFNMSVCGNKVDPEIIDAYETGIKSTFLDGAATVNLSAFRYDYSDLQVTFFTTFNGVPTVIIDNAADARIKGLELEGMFRPSRRWNVNMAVTYLDAKYLSYTDAGVDYSGNRLSRAPRFTMMAGFDYEIPMSGFFSSISIGADLKMTDRVFFKPSNRRLESAGPYDVLNAHLNLTSDQSGLALRLVGKNLLNEDIRTGLFESPAQGGLLGYGSLPRTWSLEVTKNF